VTVVGVVAAGRTEVGGVCVPASANSIERLGSVVGVAVAFGEDVMGCTTEVLTFPVADAPPVPAALGLGAASPPEPASRCCRALLIARPTSASHSCTEPFKPQSASDRVITRPSPAGACGAVVSADAGDVERVVVGRDSALGSDSGRLELSSARREGTVAGSTNGSAAL
jgi:hypothetical protein